MMPTLAVVAGRFKLPASVMLPAEKLPLPSRLTMALGVLALVAVLPRVTEPLDADTVTPPPPMRAVTPALFKVVELPSATVPPPLKPVPALTVRELLANWLLPTLPLGRVPLRLLAVFAKIA